MQDFIEGLEAEVSHLNLDLSVLLDRIDNDIELAKEVLVLFLDESKDIVNFVVTSSVLNPNRNDLKKDAHKIKGMCIDVGGEYSAYLAGTLEKVALECDNPNLQQLKLNLSKAYEQLCAEIQDWLQKN